MEQKLAFEKETQTIKVWNETMKQNVYKRV